MISEGNAFTILLGYLSIKNVCSKWKQRLLTFQQKEQRVDESKQSMELFKQ